VALSAASSAGGSGVPLAPAPSLAQQRSSGLAALGIPSGHSTAPTLPRVDSSGSDELEPADSMGEGGGMGHRGGGGSPRPPAATFVKQASASASAFAAFARSSWHRNSMGDSPRSHADEGPEAGASSRPNEKQALLGSKGAGSGGHGDGPSPNGRA
jgi:hypothetical protein